MARLDFQKVARDLTNELKAHGYECRLEAHHTHPKFYIGCRNADGELKERFTILSTTANYAEGDLLKIKSQDIKRDVLPYLPTPIKVNGTSNTSVTTPQQSETVLPTKIYPIKAHLIGAKGQLCIRVPKEAIPEHAPRGQVQLFPGNKLGLIFSPTSGKEPKLSKVGKPDNKALCYYFGTDEVPFKHAMSTPKGWKNPTLCARLIGDSLVCDKPLPNELLEQVVEKKVPKKLKEGEEHTLEDGSAIREMLNDWIAWARAKGHEPELIVTDEGELTIKVITRIVTNL